MGIQGCRANRSHINSDGLFLELGALMEQDYPLRVPIANRGSGILARSGSRGGPHTIADVTEAEKDAAQRLFDETQIYQIGGSGKDVKIRTGPYKSLKVRGVYKVRNELAQICRWTELQSECDKIAKFDCKDYINLFPRLHGRPVFHATSTAAMDSVLLTVNQGWAGRQQQQLGEGCVFCTKCHEGRPACRICYPGKVNLR